MRSRPTRTAVAAALAATALAACSPLRPAHEAHSDAPSTRTPSATASAGTPTPTASAGGNASAPLHGLVVVVDPGHNGGNGRHESEIDRPVDAGGLRKPCNTTGTQTDSGYPEHAFTWDVAKRLTALLHHDGATVVLTRHDDHGVGPCVDVRGRMAARYHADLLVSIHGDGSAETAHGFTVLRPGKVAGYTTGTYRRSDVLAADVAEAMVSHGFRRSTYLGSHGVEVRRDLGTLNLASVPAVMLEAGNMRNPTDARTLSSTGGRQRIAVALAGAVAAFEHRE
ncbi:MAG: N-acetylmuramoyl-L-alanine amidase [Acidothermales bacterium]|nr:N-acetylmuramoyl-L-alanine amidase [Acidothermales bacterium]